MPSDGTGSRTVRLLGHYPHGTADPENCRPNDGYGTAEHGSMRLTMCPSASWLGNHQVIRRSSFIVHPLITFTMSLLSQVTARQPFWHYIPGTTPTPCSQFTWFIYAGNAMATVHTGVRYLVFTMGTM